MQRVLELQYPQFNNILCTFNYCLRIEDNLRFYTLGMMAIPLGLVRISTLTS